MAPCYPAARSGATAESNEAACCLGRDTVLKCKSDDRDSLALGAVAVTAGPVAALLRPVWIGIIAFTLSGLTMLLG